MQGESQSSGEQGRYRLLIDSIPYGFYAVDAESRITEVNQAFSKLIGYSHAELIGSTFWRLIPEDEHARAERHFRDVLSGTVDTVELDIWVLRRDGARCLVRVASRTLRDGQRVVGSHGVVRDITKERETADRVQRSEVRLRLLLERMPALVWTVDADLRFTSGSGRALEALGLAEDQLVGVSIYDYFGTSDPTFPPIRINLEALKGRTSTHRIGWQGRVYEVRAEPIREDGTTVGAIGAALDVTDRLEAKRKLVEQRAQWQRLFEASPEAIVLLDGDDRVVQSNPEFERVFGYPAEEARGRPINDLIAPPDRLGEASGLSRRVKKGERISVEAIRRRKDGTLVNVSILGTPLDVGGEQWSYGIYRDITEEKKLQEQLLHSQRLEAVGQLAGGIAHDFNNILTAILGHARILATEVPEGWIREDVREIESAADRGATLTRQLLAFSRRQIPDRRPVDANDVIQAMRDMLRRLIGGHIQLDTYLRPDLPPVSIDPGQLEQVVMNLVINARDSMPSGGRVTVRTDLLRSRNPAALSRPGSASHLLVEVSDSGTGMTVETRNRIFEPFFTTKGKGKGTGLGLSIVYGIVEHSAGWIDVESEPGAGTVVSVYLPVGEHESDPETRPEPAAEAVPSGRGHERILLVDDDPAVRNVTTLVLQRQGYTVFDAASGEEAIDRAHSLDPPPDLLLTDLVMPGMSGRALASEIRNLFPAICVLFMSGYADTDSTDPARTMSNLLTKPFDPDTLARRVRETLG